MNISLYVLDGSDIENQFDETLQDLYDAVFQRYHLDVCYEISDFQIPNEGTCFTVTSPVLEDGSLRVDVFANYIIDDDLTASARGWIVAGYIEFGISVSYLLIHFFQNLLE